MSVPSGMNPIHKLLQTREVTNSMVAISKKRESSPSSKSSSLIVTAGFLKSSCLERRVLTSEGMRAAARLAALIALAIICAPTRWCFAAATASIYPGSFSFGSVAIGKSSGGQTATLRSTGTSALSITSVAITGTNASDFAQTNTCHSTLAAGAACTIRITFKPNASGSRNATLSVADNAKPSPQTIKLSGTGTGTTPSPSAPAVGFSSTTLPFGSLPVNTPSASQTVTLTNTGNTMLNITSIGITGKNPSDFTQTNTCGSSVGAGGKCTISVTFKPTASGSRSAQVGVSDNASGSPQTVNLEGTGAGTGALVLPLKASSNGRYLVDQNGTAFLLMGDSPQSIMGKLAASQMATYMADRQARGFNALWVNLLCTTYTGCNAQGTAYDGTVPFTSGSSPANYNLGTPDSAYFAEVDGMLNLAASYGLVVFLDPIETGGWLVTLEKNGASNAYNYGVYLGNRYKNFANLVWMSGNDFQTWSSSGSDNNLVHQVMLGIASADPNHLQTVELNASYSNQDSTLSNVLTLDLAYTYDETYGQVLEAYNSTPTLPVILGEANYEYENNTGSLPSRRGPMF